MAKTNRFNIKKIKENNITIEEERKNRSPFALFFLKNGKLLFIICMLLSLTVFIIAAALTISNIEESSIVMYESNGVVVTFDSSDKSIINGTPITKEYASDVFSSNITEEETSEGVVIKLKEVKFKTGKIIFYSDKTALIKYDNGTFLRVFSVGKKYGVSEKGIISRKAKTKKVTGERKMNSSLGISLLYLSDGSVEVTKGNTVFFVRNNDITSTQNVFYTNLSLVSLPVKKQKNRIYYSNNTIKEGDTLIIDNQRVSKIEEKEIHDKIKIIYYENGFAEIIKDDLSIIVEKKEHVKYDNYILEIVDNTKKEKKEINNIMDIKNIKFKNTNTTDSNYIIVLEETDDYNKHNVTRRLANEHINYNIYINGMTMENNVLNNNLKGSNKLSGVSLKNNTYLLYEGKLEKLSETSVKIGMWISYETITNEYMNSAFIGTVKVYIESLS